MGMGRVKIRQVIYGTQNIRIRFCADANEDGCQFDRDGRHWNLGLFWPARNAQSTLNKNRINAKGFRS